MKKPIAIGAGVIAILVAAGAVWRLEAATPTVGALSVNPAYVVVSTPTPVVFTIQITDPTLLPNGVNLLKVDASGKTLATIGVMHDDGLNGDAAAGDKIFSYRLTSNESAVGTTYYRSAAAFKGVLQRVQSGVAALTTDPFKLPPDPGDAGKQTLSGVDSDDDGVRDDVQRFIALLDQQAPLQRASHMQLARAVLGYTGTDASPEDLAQAHLAAVRCGMYVFGPDAFRSSADLILDAVLNTPARYQAYLRATASAPSVHVPTGQDFKASCSFNPSTV